MVNLKLWLSKSSSLHRQLHGGRGLNSQSLACESHTLPLGYHATNSLPQAKLNIGTGLRKNSSSLSTTFVAPLKLMALFS